DKEISKDAPKLKDSYDKDSQKFLDDVLEGLTLLNIPYILNTSLVRGLDYYTHTVFEFTTQLLGAQGAILSGGRYDGLIELMGGPKTPGVGWAAGIDRLVELSKEQLQHQTEKPLIAIIGADSSGEKEALKVAQELRSQDQRVEVLYSGNMGKKMKRANKLNASYALILGEQEITQSLITVKNLGTGEQKTLSRKNLSDIIPIPVIK
ncbi:MAG TPA: His/Gly/Thr/Pro-type tRNA ligase C-terminal domain-containing protein, partial [Pseudobdellovibrionaceae bacterium]|nr:His/Gly/Thr/Pro-type tRNA ligase C-terminal domain-containing protein [Pseudobdellovibrionaceae bacterium]